MWPNFDFRALPVSIDSQKQLCGIYNAVRYSNKVTSRRTQLLNLLTSNAYDPLRGVYIPVSPHLYLVGKMPDYSQSFTDMLAPGATEYFANALAIPAGYGSPTFNPDDAIKPLSRATNVGFLIVTIEFDCRTAEEFEGTLVWTRRESEGSPSLSSVDRELCRFEDYRGFSVIYSGGRSLHFGIKPVIT